MRWTRPKVARLFVLSVIYGTCTYPYYEFFLSGYSLVREQRYARWKVSENVFERSILLFRNNLKNFKIQFSELFSNCWPEFSESLKFDRETGEFGLFEFEKIRSFNIEPLLFILSRPTKIPLAYLLPTQRAVIFYLLPTRARGKKKNRRVENFAVAAANRLNFRPLSL